MALVINDRYIWDFWYIYENNLFSVFFLNCEKKYYFKDEQHSYAVVGEAKTLDFVDFFDVNVDVFHASKDSWDNTSIWTGDTVIIGCEKYLFYTSRDKNELDGSVQHIGVAKINWPSFERLDIKISAPKGFYLTYSDPEEDSIQCWRDPFVFFFDGRVYMIVAAKRDNSMVNHRGCLALLETDYNLSYFKHIKVLLNTYFSEVELPQIYKTKNGTMRIFFNAKTRDGKNKFIMTKEFSNIIDDEVSMDQEICTDCFERSKYYGFRIIPERNNIICAFNQEQGFINVFSNIGSLGLGFDKLISMKQ